MDKIHGILTTEELSPTRQSRYGIYNPEAYRYDESLRQVMIFRNGDGGG